jgi:hypothetical protein
MAGAVQQQAGRAEAPPVPMAPRAFDPAIAVAHHTRMAATGRSMSAVVYSTGSK